VRMCKYAHMQMNIQIRQLLKGDESHHLPINKICTFAHPHITSGLFLSSQP